MGYEFLLIKESEFATNMYTFLKESKRGLHNDYLKKSNPLQSIVWKTNSGVYSESRLESRNKRENFACSRFISMSGSGLKLYQNF